MGKLRSRFSTAVISFILAFSCIFSGQLAWAGNGNDTGNGNTNGTLSFFPEVPSSDGLVTLAFSPQPDKIQQQITLHFTDQTDQTSQFPLQVDQDANGQYTFKMPQLTQGHDYDVTVTINGTTYELSDFVAPVDPGHQLPETRYVILFPLALAAIFVWKTRRSGKKPIKAGSN